MHNTPPKLQMFVIPTANKHQQVDESKDDADVENKIKPLAPLYILLKILCLDRTKINIWIRIIRGLAMLVLLIGIIVWSLKIRFKYVYVHLPRIVTIADVFGFTTICSLSVFNVIYNMIANNVFCSYISDNFRTVDSLLGIVKPGLYYILKKTVLQLIIIPGIVIIFLGSFDFYTWTTTYDFYHSCPYLINYLVYTMNTTITVHFVILVYFVWSKFFILNTQLKAYFRLESKDNHTTDTFQYFIRSHRHTFLENLFLNSTSLQTFGEQAAKKKNFNVDCFMKIYMILCDQIDLLNSNFHIQNLLVSMSGLFSLIRALRVMTYFATSTSENPINNPVITSINFALYDIAILLLITTACVLTTSEAKKTFFILDTILYDRCTTRDRQKLEAWSNLMTRRFPYFTACTLFPLDYSLLYNLTGTVVTYSIIVFQIE